jgi:hypothetical protein
MTGVMATKGGWTRVDQYLDGRTIDDFRPRHLRVVRARKTGLDLEERALVSLLRSWRIRSARKAA